jgi:hypothetical protein
MGSNENFRQDCEQWSRIISGSEARGDPTEDPIDDQTDEETKEQTNYWKIVFDEHPEFFRRSRKSGGYSLIWRRALPWAHIETQKSILLRDYMQLPPPEKKAYWRPQLSDSAVETLMDVAIKMHARAVEDSRDWRWKFAPIMSFAGAAVGAVFAFAGVALFRAAGAR